MDSGTGEEAEQGDKWKYKSNRSDGRENMSLSGSHTSAGPGPSSRRHVDMLNTILDTVEKNESVSACEVQYEVCSAYNSTIYFTGLLESL